MYPEMRRAIGLINILPSIDRYVSVRLPDAPVKDVENSPTNGAVNDSVNAVTDGLTNVESSQFTPCSPWHEFPANVPESITAAAADFDRKEELATYLEIESDPWCKSVYREFQARTADLANEFYEAVWGSPSIQLKPWILEERLRFLIQLHATVSSLFDKRAHRTIDQSIKN